MNFLKKVLSQKGETITTRYKILHSTVYKKTEMTVGIGESCPVHVTRYYAFKLPFLRKERSPYFRRTYLFNILLSDKDFRPVELSCSPMQNNELGKSHVTQEDPYEKVRTSPFWDENFYIAENPDVASAGVDPVEHYLFNGWKEGRKPCRDFDAEKFKNAVRCPLLEICADQSNEYTRDFVKYLFKQNKPSAEFEEECLGVQRDAWQRTKLIAFYLPQYHIFKENEEWHGKGFTEWTNVTKSFPLFIGHEQPQLPIDVGFYDLENTNVLARQAELAKKFGVYGFCFHYYWFSGRRLMDKPINNYLKNSTINFPFCLCWANENWSRLWDGGNRELLLEQKLLPDDSEKFARDILPFFKDSRYIKVRNAPLLIIYRPKIFEKRLFNKFIEEIRKKTRKEGFDDIFILFSNFHFNEDPKEWGGNGIVEFPPHGINASQIAVRSIDPHAKLTVFDMKEYIEKRKYMYRTPFKIFKAVFPSWDNSARKAYTGATVFYGETPRLYEQWLGDCIDYTQKNMNSEEQFVFINAWNEWAEGAHLEPDHRYGYAFLNATARAIESKRIKRGRILLVGHDAYFHGAQILLLNILKTLTCFLKYRVELLLLDGNGALISEYKKYATVTIFPELKNADKYLDKLNSEGYFQAITNTTVSGAILPLLKKHHFSVVSLIHELPKIIHSMKICDAAEKICNFSDRIVFPSSFVATAFKKIAPVSREKEIILPQGLYKKNPLRGQSFARKELREMLNLPQTAKIVLFVGYGDFRKGLDIFIDTASITTDLNVFFVVVGDADEKILRSKQKQIKQISSKIFFLGKKQDTNIYYAGADILFLSSREDPFPSVVLEAFDAGIPVVGFKDAGGFQDIITEKTGVLIEHGDVHAAATTIVQMLQNNTFLCEVRNVAPTLIDEKYQWHPYVKALVEHTYASLKKVSVVIPNYNYAHLLYERLLSITEQKYPIYEIIAMDDCSTDNSLCVLEKIQKNNIPDLRIIKNEHNSGCVFEQWDKGFRLAHGDYVWIAEADDLCENALLQTNIASFSDAAVVLSYTQSSMIDEHGEITAPDYLSWTNSISKTKWKQDYVIDGIEEIKTALSIKNTIPNVSAVLFKKYEISSLLPTLRKFKVAGDLFVYLSWAQKGKIAFHAVALNKHRRHSHSVTANKNNNKKHFCEIQEIQSFCAQHFQLSSQVLEQQRAHLSEVATYLGVSK